ncbi:protein kinase [Fibrella sp. HMF5335]|uniref:Protein kinase n=1 Tax=Fibrella rubiginis TaxID=2817060 RepID=A0A939K3P5_9BACT|nr:serine/threonine-protein kinase [Fibrella rubiginis]MBO0935351.1 protein kinase [Fibrella rubiginis]
MPTVSFNVNFPDYEIISELGRGNARVLKARHRPTGDLVAIKQFALNTDPDTLRRFTRESEIMTGIEHPNVVKVREMQLEAAMPYMVMDFVEGGDVRSLLKTEGHLPLSTVTRLGLQMAEAFKAIHERGIVHRDIKPENILYRRLISGELHFLLTDFGIAKIQANDSTRTRTGQSLMTYEYAAPEQFDDPRQVNIASDYYALGVVLYEALTGQVPFVLHNDAGLASFMKQVLTAQPSPPQLTDNQFLPPSLSEAIRQMLLKDPGQRLQSANVLELLLEQAKVELLRANSPNSQVNADAMASAGWTVASPAPKPEPVYAPPVYEEPVYDEPAPDRSMWWFFGGVGVVGVIVLLFVFLNQKRPAEGLYPPVDSTATATPVDSSMLYQPSIPRSTTTEATATEDTQPSSDTVAEEPVQDTPAPQERSENGDDDHGRRRGRGRDSELDSAATMQRDTTF